ncbi:MAG: branched-chain amino acid ABC transporter permease [Desulfovibrio sp.]|nr:branched-chain amino acid ABC transporter permease [Desulfovibrio sp.]
MTSSEKNDVQLASNGLSRFFGAVLVNKRNVFYFLLVVCFFVLPISGSPYWIDLGVNIGFYTLLALSLNVILGQAGIFNMGHMAFYAVGADFENIILSSLFQEIRTKTSPSYSPLNKGIG